MVREIESVAGRFDVLKHHEAATRLRVLAFNLNDEGLIPMTIEPENTSFHHSHFDFYPDQRSVVMHGQEVRVTRFETNLLTIFGLNPNRALSQAQLVEAVWNNENYNAKNLYTLVSRLKTKLGANMTNGKFEYIQNVQGFGYKLVDPSKE